MEQGTEAPPAWENAWDQVVRALAAQPQPEALGRAVVELGVAAHRCEVTARAFNERWRTALAEAGGSGDALAAWKAWPETEAREQAEQALAEARVAVEALARVWVEGASADQAAGHESARVAAHYGQEPAAYLRLGLDEAPPGWERRGVSGGTLGPEDETPRLGTPDLGAAYRGGAGGGGS